MHYTHFGMEAWRGGEERKADGKGREGRGGEGMVEDEGRSG